MRISLRTKLIQSIESYRAIKATVAIDYEAKKAAEPDAMATLMAEYGVKEDALSAVWKEAEPEMNPVERARYVEMIGKDLAPENAKPAPSQLGRGVVAAPPIQYSLPVQEAIDRIRQVFPGAKLLAVAKPGEHVELPGESAFERQRRASRAGDVSSVTRVARPQPAPAAPAKSQNDPAMDAELGLF